MKYSIAIAILAALCGCSTTGLTFENRIACSLAKDKAFLVSEWGGRIGISSTISDKDRAEVCK